MTGSSNASILRSVVREAEALSSAVASSGFPVFIRPLLGRRRVSSVVFQPLLVDAMLTTHADGFRIFLNSAGREPRALRQELESENAKSLMQGRMRFSIAHELAHTFFYDLESSPPCLAKTFRAGGGKNVLENLERKCDVIAGHILLPSPLLRKEILKIDSITPASIIGLASRAGVSLEALMRRLGESSPLLRERYFRGCIVLLRKDAKGILIKAISKARLLPLAEPFHAIRTGGAFPPGLLHGNVLECLEPVRNLEIELPISTRLSSKRASYKVNAELVSSNGTLVTFEEIVAY